MKSPFERINRLPPYIFSEINSLKLKLRAEKKDIIDFGMGNPDMATQVIKLSKKCKIIVSLSLFQKQELEKVTYMMFYYSN